MKTTILCALTLMILLCAPLHAQSITGTWQGTLPLPEGPRVALKLTTAEDGSLHGTLSLIDKLFDRGPLAAALSSASFTPPNLTLEQVNVGMQYKGTLRPDGKSIDGTWTEGNRPYPLTLTLATPETLWKPTRTAMSPTGDPTFEVAAIKPSPPDAQGSSYSLRTRNFKAKNRSVLDLLKFSYKLRDRQISGGPSWLATARFDIVAEPDLEGLPSIDQYRLMIRKLLASRFHLQVHLLQQTFPVYALTRDSNAPRLPHSDPQFDGAGNAYVSTSPDGQTSLHFVGETMPLFADALMNFIQDRQIVDETGLPGNYEFTITVPAADLDDAPSTGATDDRPTAFRHAIHPLGFKLTAKKSPIDVIVIDHLEMPSAN